MRMLDVSVVRFTAEAMVAHGSAHEPQVELVLLPFAAGNTKTCPARHKPALWPWSSTPPLMLSADDTHVIPAEEIGCAAADRSWLELFTLTVTLQKTLRWVVIALICPFRCCTIYECINGMMHPSQSAHQK
jgi:hypothetical protein